MGTDGASAGTATLPHSPLRQERAGCQPAGGARELSLPKGRRAPPRSGRAAQGHINLRPQGACSASQRAEQRPFPARARLRGGSQVHTHKRPREPAGLPAGPAASWPLERGEMGVGDAFRGGRTASPRARLSLTP